MNIDYIDYCDSIKEWRVCTTFGQEIDEWTQNYFHVKRTENHYNNLKKWRKQKQLGMIIRDEEYYSSNEYEREARYKITMVDIAIALIVFLAVGAFMYINN